MCGGIFLTLAELSDELAVSTLTFISQTAPLLRSDVRVELVACRRQWECVCRGTGVCRAPGQRLWTPVRYWDCWEAASKNVPSLSPIVLVLDSSSSTNKVKTLVMNGYEGRRLIQSDSHTLLLPVLALPSSEEGVLVIDGSGRPRSIPLLPLHNVQLAERSVPVLPVLRSSSSTTASASSASSSRRRRCHHRRSSSRLHLVPSLLGRSRGRRPARRQRRRLRRATGSAGQVCMEQKQPREREKTGKQKEKVRAKCK